MSNDLQEEAKTPKLERRDSKSNLSELYAPFCPREVIRRFQKNLEPLESAESSVFWAVVFFLDISGFTPLSEALCGKGSEGVNELASTVNDYFGKIINVIESNGGDVLKFCGDAVMAMWRNTHEDGIVAADGTLSPNVDTMKKRNHRVLEAFHCGLQMQEKLGTFVAAGKILRIKIGISAGDVSAIYVGGHHHRWEFMLSGVPLSQLSLANDLADSGDVIVTREAWAQVRSLTQVLPRLPPVEVKKGTGGGGGKQGGGAEAGGGGLRARTLRRIQTGVTSSVRRLRKASSERIGRGGDSGGGGGGSGLSEGERARCFQLLACADPAEVVPEDEELWEANSVKLWATASLRIRAFIPLAAQTSLSSVDIASRKERGIVVRNRLAEMRTVTVLFISLHGLAVKNSDGEVSILETARVQTAMMVIQTAVYKRAGTIRQMVQDDKGVVCIAVYGIPPYLHEDDTLRATLAAVECFERLQAEGIACSIGVATGRVYCGLVGDIMSRCEYAVIGDTVNLSARLMGYGMKKGYDVLIEENTFWGARDGACELTPLTPIRVKGKSHLIPIYVPSLEKDPTIPTAHLHQGAKEKVELTRSLVRHLSGYTLSSRVVAKKRSRLSSPAGRVLEQRAVLASVAALLSGTHQTLLCLGAPGMGKTVLAQFLATNLANKQGEVFWGSAGNQTDGRVPLYPWKAVFVRLLGLDQEYKRRLSGFANGSTTMAELRQALTERVAAVGMGLEDSLPLLNALFPKLFSENRYTRGLHGSHRSAVTVEYLTVLFLSLASKPSALVMDDLHQFDSMSWKLLLSICLRISGRAEQHRRTSMMVSASGELCVATPAHTPPSGVLACLRNHTPSVVVEEPEPEPTTARGSASRGNSPMFASLAVDGGQVDNAAADPSPSADTASSVEQPSPPPQTHPLTRAALEAANAAAAVAAAEEARAGTGPASVLAPSPLLAGGAPLMAPPSGAVRPIPIAGLAALPSLTSLPLIDASGIPALAPLTSPQRQQAEQQPRQQQPQQQQQAPPPLLRPSNSMATHASSSSSLPLLTVSEPNSAPVRQGSADAPLLLGTSLGSGSGGGRDSDDDDDVSLVSSPSALFRPAVPGEEEEELDQGRMRVLSMASQPSAQHVITLRQPELKLLSALPWGGAAATKADAVAEAATDGSSSGTHGSGDGSRGPRVGDVVGSNTATHAAVLRLLDAVPLLRGLPLAARTEAAARMRLLQFKEFDDIIRMGDTEDKRFYLIFTGRVHILLQPRHNLEASSAELLDTRGDAQYFGEAALLTGAPRNASVVAASPVLRCLMLEKTDYDAVVAGQVGPRSTQRMLMGPPSPDRHVYGHSPASTSHRRRSHRRRRQHSSRPHSDSSYSGGSDSATSATSGGSGGSGGGRRGSRDGTDGLRKSQRRSLSPLARASGGGGGRGSGSSPADGSARSSRNQNRDRSGNDNGSGNRNGNGESEGEGEGEGGYNIGSTTTPQRRQQQEQREQQQEQQEQQSIAIQTSSAAGDATAGGSRTAVSGGSGRVTVSEYYAPRVPPTAALGVSRLADADFSALRDHLHRTGTGRFRLGSGRFMRQSSGVFVDGVYTFGVDLPGSGPVRADSDGSEGEDDLPCASDEGGSGGGSGGGGSGRGSDRRASSRRASSRRDSSRRDSYRRDSSRRDSYRRDSSRRDSSNRSRSRHRSRHSSVASRHSSTGSHRGGHNAPLSQCEEEEGGSADGGGGGGDESQRRKDRRRRRRRRRRRQRSSASPPLARWQQQQPVLRPQPLLVCMFSRPMAVPTQQFQALLMNGVTSVLQLQPMDEEETRQQLCRALDVDEVRDDVIQLVLSKGQGNPFFTEQLIQVFFKSGCVRARYNKRERILQAVIPSSVDLHSIPIPNRVEDAIIAGIARLTRSQQDMLKVAAVAGDDFDHRIISHVCGRVHTNGVAVTASRAQATELQLREDLGFVVSQKLLRRVAAGSSRYEFRSVIMRDTIYSLVSFSRKQSLHRQVAHTLANCLEKDYAHIGMHFAKGGQLARALWYLRKGSQVALSRAQYMEAVFMIHDFLDLQECADDLLPPLHAASMQRYLATALLALGHASEAQHCLELGLTILGHRVPGSNCVLPDYVITGGYTTRTQRDAALTASKVRKDFLRTLLGRDDSDATVAAAAAAAAAASKNAADGGGGGGGVAPSKMPAKFNNLTTAPSKAMRTLGAVGGGGGEPLTPAVGDGGEDEGEISGDGGGGGSGGGGSSGGGGILSDIERLPLLATASVVGVNAVQGVAHWLARTQWHGSVRASSLDRRLMGNGELLAEASRQYTMLAQCYAVRGMQSDRCGVHCMGGEPAHILAAGDLPEQDFSSGYGSNRAAAAAAAATVAEAGSPGTGSSGGGGRDGKGRKRKGKGKVAAVGAQPHAMASAFGGKEMGGSSRRSRDGVSHNVTTIRMSAGPDPAREAAGSSGSGQQSRQHSASSAPSGVAALALDDGSPMQPLTAATSPSAPVGGSGSGRGRGSGGGGADPITVAGYRNRGLSKLCAENTQLVRMSLLHAANLAEKASVLPELARALVALALQPWCKPRLALQYARRARLVLTVANDPVGTVDVYLSLCTYHLVSAHWERAEEMARRAAQTYRDGGDRIRWQQCMLRLCEIEYLKGDFHNCRLLVEEIIPHATELKDARTLMHLHLFLVRCDHLPQMASRRALARVQLAWLAADPDWQQEWVSATPDEPNHESDVNSGYNSATSVASSSSRRRGNNGNASSDAAGSAKRNRRRSLKSALSNMDSRSSRSINLSTPRGRPRSGTNGGSSARRSHRRGTSGDRSPGRGDGDISSGGHGVSLCVYQTDRALALSTSALVLLRMGFPQRASRLALQAAAVLADISRHYSHFHAHVAICEVGIALWARRLGEDSPRERALAERCARSVAALDSFAKRYPFAVPAAQLWKGNVAWVSDRQQQAQRHWGHAQERAHSSTMKQLEATTLLEIGRHLPKNSHAREDTLLRALRLFSAVPDLFSEKKVMAALPAAAVERIQQEREAATRKHRRRGGRSRRRRGAGAGGRGKRMSSYEREEQRRRGGGDSGWRRARLPSMDLDALRFDSYGSSGEEGGSDDEEADGNYGYGARGGNGGRFSSRGSARGSARGNARGSARRGSSGGGMDHLKLPSEAAIISTGAARASAAASPSASHASSPQHHGASSAAAAALPPPRRRRPSMARLEELRGPGELSMFPTAPHHRAPTFSPGSSGGRGRSSSGADDYNSEDSAFSEDRFRIAHSPSPERAANSDALALPNSVHG